MSNSYFTIIDQLIASIHSQNYNNLEFMFKDVVSQLKLSHKQICQRECGDIYNSKMHVLIALVMSRNVGVLLGWLKSVLQILYMKQSPLLKVVYQFVPAILRQYIQIKDSKNTDLEQAIKVIVNNQIDKYYRYIKDNEEFRNNAYVRELYQIHFNKHLHGKGENSFMQLDRSFDKEQIVFNSERQKVKIILLYVIYRNLECLSAKALKDYLHTIYIYCGGDNKDYESRSSFYHLQKKNAFNPFKYSISEQQMEWMLMSLYELSIESQFDKYELLAAINMVYKKTANQSMFKYSEIAQSIIHILEDEYKDIFA